MDNQTTSFSKQEMLSDATSLLYAFADNLHRIYRPTGTHQLLGVPEKIFESGDTDAILSAMRNSPPAMATHLSLMYDYAFEGVLYEDSMDWSVIEEDIVPFSLGFMAMEGFMENNASVEIRFDRCQHVVDLAMARHYLDEGCFVMDGEETLFNHLTLRQVALLAGIDEKTVRNIASSKSKKLLTTTSINGRTYVRTDIALDWLKSRGFRETVIRRSTTERDMSKTVFYNLADFGTFIVERREAQKMSATQIAAALKDRNASNWLKNAEEGRYSFDENLSLKLAVTLELEPRSFLMAALKVFHKAELERIEQMPAEAMA